MKPDPKDLVANTSRVRVRSGATGTEHVFVEGKVVAYSPDPQICVEADDGTQSWWPVTLPIDVVKPLPPEPPVGSVVLRRFMGDQYGAVYRRYPNGWFQPGGEGDADDGRSWTELHDDAEVVLLVPLEGATARVIEAAKAWRKRIADSVSRGGVEPRVWADDEDLELINALDALTFEVGERR